MEKKCSECSLVKPLTEFHKKKCNKDGHRGICKACRCIKSKAYREANRERIAEYEVAHRERRATYNRAYRTPKSECNTLICVAREKTMLFLFQLIGRG